MGQEFTEDDVFVRYITINIEDVKVGDFVYSYNTITGEIELQEVTATFELESDHVNYLTFVDENGEEQIVEATDVHPFFVITNNPDLDREARESALDNGNLICHDNISAAKNGYWVEAKDLLPGDVCFGANGELLTLVSTDREDFGKFVTVYNLHIEGNHNYFIIAEGELGQTCILVHNARRNGCGADSGGDYDTPKFKRDKQNNNKRAGHQDESGQLDSLRKKYRPSHKQDEKWHDLMDEAKIWEGRKYLEYHEMEEMLRKAMRMFK